MTTSLDVRDKLEATVAEYRHVRGEHGRAGREGRVRRHLQARLDSLEAHFDRLLDEWIADEGAREAWRRRLRTGAPAPAEPAPPKPLLLFKGRSAGGSLAEVRQCADGSCDVFVDEAHVERVAAARDLAETETPLAFTIGGQAFTEIFETPPPALSAARAHFSGPSGEPPWEYAADLAADGLIDGTFALTPRGRRALAERRTSR